MTKIWVAWERELGGQYEIRGYFTSEESAKHWESDAVLFASGFKLDPSRKIEAVERIEERQGDE